MKVLRQHWPEYLMEAWGLGVFMISAGVVSTILEYRTCQTPEIGCPRAPHSSLERRAYPRNNTPLQAVGHQ